MRSVFVVLAAIAATVVSAGPVAAQDFRKAPSASSAARLQLSESRSDARAGTRVYIVQMSAKPAASYSGGVAGFARTKPAAGARYNSRSGEAQMYAQHLALQQDKLLASIGASDRKVYSYRHALNGFAARLTAGEAAKLRKNKSVLRVWEDRALPLDTNNSPSYLGLTNPERGLRAFHGLTGENVVIGMIDTGAVQEHPSFHDIGYDPPSGWNGVCQGGQGWSVNDCNNKLIGSRWFAAGFSESGDAVPGEFFSPRDSDGHGTHTATTAGGNRARATINGTRLTWVSGMAHRARLAIYKACWAATDPNFSGCYFSDTTAATDAAVADGVDIISYSIGTASSFTDPTDIAFLGAFDAGVLVSRSAGNEGPGAGSTAAGEPWAITVAASTHRGNAFVQATTINAPASIAGDYASLEGAITQSLVESGDITDDVVAADPIEACAPIAPVDGIVLIARGTCFFSDKLTNAFNSGASAAIVYSQAGNPKTVMGGDATPESLQIPGVMVDNEVGVAILAELTNAVVVNATLSAGSFITEAMTGNIMAGFSSRGPFIEGNWLKPDVTGPGVQVLAGATPEPNDGSAGDFFQYLQGTSMSTPHIAGVAALLLEEHPDWSPAVVKSALMTTAGRRMVKEDGTTKADPFDLGAGHIIPNRAIDPGLAYDSELFDYQAATCGTDEPLVSEDDCTFLSDNGFSLEPENLNLASIAVDGVIGQHTVTRTVTNVSDASATYTADVSSPPGFRTRVNPTSLTLGPGETGSFEVTFTNKTAPSGEWRFGSLTWRDGTHNVRSPIAVNALALIAPEAIEGTGADGSATFDVTFGFAGAYTASAHGMAEPFLTLFEVTDDPFDSFDFSLDTDEPLVYLLELPAGTAYAQWSLFDAYNDDPGHDLDMYLFYCPDFFCTQIDQSFTFTSTEQVSVTLPVVDDAIDDPYAVIVHGFNTTGGATAQSILFDWTALDDEGNLTITAPTSVTFGQTAPVTVEWAGLLTGPGEKQVGAVSHGSPTGVAGVTSINIANDEGSGFCDLVAC